MIKKILATIILTVVAQNSQAFYVVGDSISATRNSWPQVMREQYGSWIRADVQSMRALASYFPSPDTIGVDGHATLAIMALGFNDGSYMTNDWTTPQDYFNKLADTIANWRWHSGPWGFRKVIVVVPPDTPSSLPEHDEIRLQAQLYCALMTHFWNQEWLHCIDWGDIGYFDNTSDGVHPTQSFSREMAAHMYNEILNFAPEALGENNDEH